jgi:hypothetical protein
MEGGCTARPFQNSKTLAPVYMNAPGIIYSALRPGGLSWVL